MYKCTENWGVQRPHDHVLSTEKSGHGGRREIKETQTERGGKWESGDTSEDHCEQCKREVIGTLAVSCCRGVSSSRL